MKNKSLFVFMLLSVMSYGQSKKDSSEVIKVTYHVLSNQSDFPRPYSYSFDAYLMINDSIGQYVFDREEKTVKEGNSQTTIGELKYINNYNYKSGVMEEQRKLKKQKIRAIWRPEYHWQITDETKSIKGYSVRKAVANSIEIDSSLSEYYGKVIVWFAEEIPIPVGPGRYCGLPGLILELKYEHNVRKVTLKSIEFNDNTQIQDISDGILLEDERDVIYYLHHNPSKVRKMLRKKTKG